MIDHRLSSRGYIGSDERSAFELSRLEITGKLRWRNCFLIFAS